MLKTDYVLWLASGAESQQLQLYSATMDMPDILSTNSYVTTFDASVSIEFTKFYSSRLLESTQEDTYVIPLD